MTYLGNPEKLLKLLTQLWGGLGNTLFLFFATLVLSLPLGLLVALLRRSQSPVLRAPISFYILIMRGTPLILQIFAIYFTIPLLLGHAFDRMSATVIAFVLNYAAYFAEIFRGGIDTVARGQWEAGKALGMNRAQVFLKIILPQVVKIVLPSVTNEVITLVKDTSLVYSVSYIEMFATAKQIAAAETTIIPFIIAGVYYYIFNAVVAWIMATFEKKLNYYR